MALEIAGMGCTIPDRCVSNADLVNMMNTSEEFIIERTGVIYRHHAASGQACSDLMIPAAIQAMENAGIGPSEIDFLLVNTLSPDHHDPSQACLIQRKLGLDCVPAMDLRAQCSGFVYGLELADALLNNEKYENILIICGEVLSKRMDCSDRGRNLAILLGDGAAAAVVRKTDDSASGMLDCQLGADGNYFDLLMTKAPGSAGMRFLTPEQFEAGETEFVMNGRPMFEHASGTLIRLAKETLEHNDLTLDDIDYVICHQPNLRILDCVREELRIPKEKFLVTVHKLGNMASASLPATLALNMNRLSSGQTVLCLAYGSGATWGSLVYRVP
ncbi:beta-ketoacyl-ACP synthase 3 [Microbulbifer elongatus]|uniref:beta-ketoacyl-ACP synthase 3 n=1 Tax=Microbulbifer elongatus TaxID=86173 RepID=UPI001E57D2A2|nr:beta-ketoacyl-ACP synthase 3 [Microbulbifer elongatus]